MVTTHLYITALSRSKVKLLRQDIPSGETAKAAKLATTTTQEYTELYRLRYVSTRDSQMLVYMRNGLQHGSM